MKRTCIGGLLAAVAALLAVAATPAGAQLPRPDLIGRTDGRLWLDGFFSRYHVTAELPSRVPSVGGRAMWWLASPGDPGASPIARRVALGGFVVRTTDAGAPELSHVGLEADLRVLERPIAGALDPMLTLGAGFMRFAERSRGGDMRPLTPYTWLPGPGEGTAPDAASPWRRAPARRASGAQRIAGVALSPGLGARLGILPGIVLRADARRVVLVPSGAPHGVELSAGLSWTL